MCLPIVRWIACMAETNQANRKRRAVRTVGSKTAPTARPRRKSETVNLSVTGKTYQEIGRQTYAKYFL